MANTLLTVDMITREALRVAHEKASFIGTTSRQYDPEFNKAVSKQGDTLRIRKSNQFTRRQGSRIMDVQDLPDSNTTLTTATQDGVDMKVNSAELALSIDDFSERYITPAVSQLISGIESDYLIAMTKATYQTTGTAGTVVGTSGDISAITNARARLNQMLAPKDGGRCIQLDSITMGTVVNGLKALFQDTTQVKEAFREGFYSRNSMADWYENERTWTIANSDDVSGSTDAAALVTDGGTTIDMHTLIPVAKQVVGEVFTVAGVYDCHPETKQAYSNLKQFTITAIGATKTTISPATYLTGARKNVCKSDGTDLLTTSFDAQVVTPWGSASTSYRQNLMYHKDAFAIAFVDLPIMADAAFCVNRNDEGISLRVWKGSDIRNDEFLIRIDALYGFAAIRPEWACRISN